jgi:hypothetical protein
LSDTHFGGLVKNDFDIVQSAGNCSGIADVSLYEFDFGKPVGLYIMVNLVY